MMQYVETVLDSGVPAATIGMPTVQFMAPQTSAQLPLAYAPQVAYAAMPPTHGLPVAMRQVVPSGAEMVQITIFGTKQIAGTTRPSVEIEVVGKPFKHTIDTFAITGPAVVPSSLITYYTPGEDLHFIVSEGSRQLGQVHVHGDQFHPNGIEGDLQLNDPETNNPSDGHLWVKIVPLGLTGQAADLSPIHIAGEKPPMEAAAPYVAMQGGLRPVSQEEWQRLGGPGAAQVVMQAEPQLVMTQQPVYAPGGQQMIYMMPTHPVVQQPQVQYVAPLPPQQTIRAGQPVVFKQQASKAQQLVQTVPAEGEAPPADAATAPAASSDAAGEARGGSEGAGAGQ
eukprot:TRINITY_DN23736_c0_g1_i1.p1 TRINITY_DN23736_c0_g1~~TRINITY_DN23736_c0_g1_i1.p1  ORF type:complete len:338 (+),score=87.88 TRINITY_DN23736_c0_g1_i1:96-1109(+)